MRVAVMALAIVSIALAASTLYKNRGRMVRSDFCLFYSWWNEYPAGIDPWHPVFPPSTPLTQRVNYCDYTPAAVILLSPLGRLEVNRAYWTWLGIQIGSLVLTILMLTRQIRPPPSADTVVAIVALAMLFPEFHATLYEAQPTMLLLLILTAAWVFERSGHPVAAGLTLALAALFKIYPATLGGLFLFRRRFQPIAWAAVFTILGIVATGPGRWREFLSIGVPLNIHHWIDPRAIAILSNVYSAIVKIHGGVPTAVFGPLNIGITATLDLAVIAGAAIVTLRAAEDRETDGLCFGLWLAVALLISPLTWHHELLLLMPLYIFAGVFAFRGGIDSPGGFGLLAIGLAGFVITYFWGTLREIHLYFIMTVATYVAGCILVATRGSTRGAVEAPSHAASSL